MGVVSQRFEARPTEGGAVGTLDPPLRNAYFDVGCALVCSLLCSTDVMSREGSSVGKNPTDPGIPTSMDTLVPPHAQKKVQHNQNTTGT